MKIFEKRVRELFELTMRVKQETNAHVEFDFVTDREACTIWIKNGNNKNYYDIYGQEILVGHSSKNFEDAKDHLLRILEQKKKG